ncbi:MAG: ABC transporter ATP-binding protein [Azospirillaceae bacterium]
MDKTGGAAGAVELKGVVKRFADFVAVHRMDLGIARGSFVTLLGPSGCGKTTTLRMIAGLEDPSEGDILIKGRRVNALPIHKRNLGVVFQNYALFPHKTIFDNVAFGLKYRGVNRSDAREKVRRALELVRLPHVEDRLPNQLSGGQQQRIALARAIVIEPDVLLLDEPLSALDANLRENMRVELKRIQRELGITTVFVTHDQAEALAMSDRVVVMSQGHIEQIGPPQQVYDRPRSSFVAGFLGHSNMFDGTVSGISEGIAEVAIDGVGRLRAAIDGAGAPDGPVRVVVRAEKLRLGPPDMVVDGAESVLSGTVSAVDYQGQAARYFVEVAGHTLQVINPIDGAPYGEGTAVALSLRPKDCVLLPGHGGARDGAA